jgi:hypothetical protein
VKRGMRKKRRKRKKKVEGVKLVKYYLFSFGLNSPRIELIRNEILVGINGSPLQMGAYDNSTPGE